MQTNKNPFKGLARGDGEQYFTNDLIGTNNVIDLGAPGHKLYEGDTSTGKLAVPNPYFTGRGTHAAHYWGDGGYQADPGYRNYARILQKQLATYNYDPRLTAQYERRTAVPLPNLLPWDYEG